MKKYFANFGHGLNPAVFVLTRTGTRKLHPRNDLRDHSPTGFSWGYNGSGPAQLALAILCDCLDDDQRALRIYQQFKFNCIANLEQETGWELSEEEVLAHVDMIERIENGNTIFTKERT